MSFDGLVTRAIVNELSRKLTYGKIEKIYHAACAPFLPRRVKKLGTDKLRGQDLFGFQNITPFVIDTHTFPFIIASVRRPCKGNEKIKTHAMRARAPEGTNKKGHHTGVLK